MLDVLKAREMIPAAPPGLPAMVFCRRPPSGRMVSVFAVGDIGFHGRVRTEGTRHGYGKLFEAVAPVLRTGDVVFGNLESLLVRSVAARGTFTGEPEAAKALAEVGFTLLNLANNHIYDLGADGLASTMGAVEAAGLKILGAGANMEAARRPVCTHVGGLKVGWLGCAHALQVQSTAGPHYAEFDEESLFASIRQSRTQVDVLVVSIHIGYEYLNVPCPTHKMMAEKCVSMGADLVLLHHPHVLQGVQLIDDKSVVCYSLGNFLFDSRGGYVEIDTALKERYRGAVFTFQFDASGICLAAALPIYVDDDFRVQWALNSQGREILEHLGTISRHIGPNLSSVFHRQRTDRNVAPAFKVLWFHLRQGNWRILVGLLIRIRLRHAFMALKWFGTKCHLASRDERP